MDYTLAHNTTSIYGKKGWQSRLFVLSGNKSKANDKTARKVKASQWSKICQPIRRECLYLSCGQQKLTLAICTNFLSSKVDETWSCRVLCVTYIDMHVCVHKKKNRGTSVPILNKSSQTMRNRKFKHTYIRIHTYTYICIHINSYLIKMLAWLKITFTAQNKMKFNIIYICTYIHVHTCIPSTHVVSPLRHNT